MSTIKTVLAEINDLTSKLIEVGLCEDQNYPTQKTFPSTDFPVEEIGVTGLEEVSIALRDRPYNETYAVLVERRAFNMRLIDGGLIQFRYRFKQGVLVKHVLAFYPSPSLLEYQNAPDLYDEELLYADVIRKDVVTSPIRFDFDEGAFEEYVHPKSHLTIGQYKNCRIPVVGGITPFRFVNFVLRAFYHTPFQEYCSGWAALAGDFDQTITARERADLHLSLA